MASRSTARLSRTLHRSMCRKCRCRPLLISTLLYWLGDAPDVPAACSSAAQQLCSPTPLPPLHHLIVMQANCWHHDHGWLQNWWEGVEEKPAAVAIIVGAITGVWALSGLVDAIDKLPIIGGLLEVIGLIVTGWFVYRYLLFEPDRCSPSAHLET